MQGNQLLSPQHRVMVVAIFFALGAGLVFLAVWQWPRIVALFPQNKDTEMSLERTTYEEKLRILQELDRSRSERSGASEMSEAQKETALESVSQPDESGFTEEQKLEILNAIAH